MSEAEIRRLRDVLNADAADATCKPTEHMSGRASVIDHVRCAADNFNESYWSDFEHMTAAEQDVVWAEVHDAISTCLIALGEETVARVTTDELRSVALDLTHARDADEKSPPELLAVLTRASNELIEMSERAEPVSLSNLTGELGESTPEFVAAIRKAADEIESGPRYAGTVLHALVEDLFELGYEPETEPHAWTAEPPEYDCFWKPHRCGAHPTTSLRYRDKRYWTDQSSYSPEQMVYSGENGGRFLVIPGGIPVCPEVTP